MKDEKTTTHPAHPFSSLIAVIVLSLTDNAGMVLIPIPIPTPSKPKIKNTPNPRRTSPPYCDIPHYLHHLQQSVSTPPQTTRNQPLTPVPLPQPITYSEPPAMPPPQRPSAYSPPSTAVPSPHPQSPHSPRPYSTTHPRRRQNQLCKACSSILMLLQQADTPRPPNVAVETAKVPVSLA